MSTLGNALWIFFGGGIFIFLGYLWGGVVLCMTIVGIPFGIQCIKLSILGLMPFGETIRYKPSAPGCLSTIMNLIWFLSGGILLTVLHLIFALICAVTIIGIPFAKQHIKLLSLALSPFGKEVTSI
ncbi:MAG: YccF domain-containing protein [Candidatus Marinimicrobia bacterium]|nr:YccF domain-containing protein [Candidatus Neomarinimicrobiota bacterium]